MTYREYIRLTENFGLERKDAVCYYMGHGVCIFWFDTSNAIMNETELLNHTGIVKMVNDCEIVNESTDKETIRNFIIKRMEDIKAIKVNKKLKTMEKDFE
ncbi:MAG: hypothetical protein J6V44_06410 [Methanobrevibacter sp.]|nr:hypothetical protein [Methanobrevibacter sp.]